MKENVTCESYDTRLWPGDWRYSAAIVGLMRYFNYNHIQYHRTSDYIEYNQSDICGEEAQKKYLLFAENYFKDSMHHRLIEDILSNDEMSAEQIKAVNEKLKANSVCKRIFGKMKYPENSKEEILEIIQENRLELIQETFRTGQTMYAKYANTNKLFSKSDKISRLSGYYIDLPKKGKSVAYKWDYSTYAAEDEPEFDYIVFAFTKTREAVFINNNCDIDSLFNTNDELQRKIDEDKGVIRNPRSYLFGNIRESSIFIEYDVEVILKSQDRDIFETLYIRRRAIEIFKNISKKRYNVLTIPCRLENGDYIPCENIVTDSVLNNLYLDNLIQALLKEKSKKTVLISILIEINQMIYGGNNMEAKTYYAKETAKLVSKKIDKNKVNSYQQKLISAICFKDYDKYCDILLNLSAYSGIAFDFAYDLFDDFEKNKNIAYAFAIALDDGNKEKAEIKKNDVEG